MTFLAPLVLVMGRFPGFIVGAEAHKFDLSMSRREVEALMGKPNVSDSRSYAYVRDGHILKFSLEPSRRIQGIRSEIPGSYSVFLNDWGDETKGFQTVKVGRASIANLQSLRRKPDAVYCDLSNASAKSHFLQVHYIRHPFKDAVETVLLFRLEDLPAAELQKVKSAYLAGKTATIAEEKYFKDENESFEHMTAEKWGKSKAAYIQLRTAKGFSSLKLAGVESRYILEGSPGMLLWPDLGTVKL